MVDFERHRPTNKFLNPKCHQLHENENLLSDRRGNVFQHLNAIIPLKFPKKLKFSFLFEMTGEKPVAPSRQTVIRATYWFSESQRILRF